MISAEQALTIPPDQAWFWTERWQRMEKSAQADIDAARVEQFKNVDEAIASLELLKDASD